MKFVESITFYRRFEFNFEEMLGEFWKDFEEMKILERS